MSGQAKYNRREKTYVAERRAHDDGPVAVLLVVVVDLLHRQDTWVLIAFVGFSGSLLVPIEDLLEVRLSFMKDIRVELTRPTKGEIRVTPASAQATA